MQVLWVCNTLARSILKNLGRRDLEYDDQEII